MNAAADPETPAEPGRPPLPVRTSVWLLAFSAATELFFGVLTLVAWNTATDNAMKHVPAGTTPAQWRTEVHALLGINAAAYVLFGALYALFAFHARKGRTWARTGTVAVAVVSALLIVFSGATLVTVVSVLIQLVAVALLYTPTAKPYFPRRAR